MSENEVAIVNQMSGISTRITPAILAEMKEQRQQLEAYVQEQLRDGTDYGVIPGVKTKSLFKPGAEKLASIYQLGSRIVKTDRTIDIEKNFAMFEITIEIFHVPTGKAIAQCTGVTNSQEKKWREKTKWVNGKNAGTEPQLVGDILNTMSKIAQKRAYVGGVVMATKASDFLTHDLAEDEEIYNDENPGWLEKQQAQQEAARAQSSQVNNKAAPQAKATQGSFDSFQGGGFKSPNSEPPLDPEEEKKKALLREVAVERSRLQWTPPQMAKYVTDNSGKQPNELNVIELEWLVAALKKEKKK